MAGTGTRRAPKARNGRRHLAAAGVGVAIPLLGTVAASAADSYTVKSGDTLSDIAHKQGGHTDWHKLYAANKSVVGGNPNLILPGQKLNLDGKAAPSSKPAPKPAPATKSSNEQQHAQQRYVEYTTKAGDTLGSIAHKYHVPGGWQRVYQDNKSALGGDPGALRVGVKLRIDTKGGPVAHPVAQQQHSSPHRAKAQRSQPSTSSSRSNSGTPTAVTSGSPQTIAKSMMSSSQFACFSNIVSRESGWNPRAANPSGAYGLVQALPGSKMASAGSDWRTNPATQIKWGLGYMNSRYGSPCGAWSFWQSHNWY